MAQRTQCGINIDPTNDKGKPSVGELQDLGAGWVRFVLKVPDDSLGALEAAFNMDIYRRYLADLGAAGIRTLLVLNNETVPGWPGGNRDPNAPEWAEYLTRYADRCRRIAQHYRGQVAAFQIWNEPDYAAPHPGYDPVVPAEVFGRMLKQAFTAIKEVHPEAKVVTGGLVSGNAAWLDRVKVAGGNRIFADAVAVHPYGQRPENDWPSPNWGFGTVKGLIGEYFKRSKPIPVWISEIGTDDLNSQGQFPQRAYESVNRNLQNVVQVAFWFCWSDGMVPPFGLRGNDGGAKESYGSYQRFARPGAGPAGVAAVEGTSGDQPPTNLRNALLKAAVKRRALHLDADNPLQRAILADGYVPNSPEFGVELDGVHHRAQRADDPRTGKSRMYYAQGPSGHPITWVEQEQG